MRFGTWTVKWEPRLLAQLSLHPGSNPSVNVPIHSSLTWAHPHVAAAPLRPGVDNLPVSGGVPGSRLDKKKKKTHNILVLLQQLFQINWQLLSGLCCFNILLCFLTSVSDGGRAGSQHVSRSRDTRSRKKKRLRFQVNTSIYSFTKESHFEQHVN